MKLDWGRWCALTLTLTLDLLTLVLTLDLLTLVLTLDLLTLVLSTQIQERLLLLLRRWSSLDWRDLLGLDNLLDNLWDDLRSLRGPLKGCQLLLLLLMLLERRPLVEGVHLELLLLLQPRRLLPDRWTSCWLEAQPTLCCWSTQTSSSSCTDLDHVAGCPCSSSGPEQQVCIRVVPYPGDTRGLSHHVSHSKGSSSSSKG